MLAGKKKVGSIEKTSREHSQAEKLDFWQDNSNIVWIFLITKNPEKQEILNIFNIPNISP